MTGPTRPIQRKGHTFVELIIASTSGTILLAGLSGSLYIASQGFDQDNPQTNQTVAQQILGDLMADLSHAMRFTERTANAVTFTVPDRTGDGRPETIRYAWEGEAGEPLTYQYNNSEIVTLATDVQSFDLSYLTRMATSNAVPLSAGIVFEEFTEKKEKNSTTTLAIDLPSGTNDGDLLIACVAIDGDVTSSIALPAGWNVADVGQEQGAVTFGVLWKIATTNEANTVQFTWANDQKALAWTMRFTGHNTSAPINALATAAGTNSSPTSPPVISTVGNAMILRLGGFDRTSVATGDTGLAGHTTITMDKSGSDGGNVSGGAGYATQITAGDSGTANFSLTDSEAYRTVTIAIAPNPGM